MNASNNQTWTEEPSHCWRGLWVQTIGSYFFVFWHRTETLIQSKENNHVLVAEYVHDNYIVCLQEVYAYLHTQFSGSNRLLRLDGMYYEAMDQ